jgi:hypothetical protein
MIDFAPGYEESSRAPGVHGLACSPATPPELSTIGDLVRLDGIELVKAVHICRDGQRGHRFYASLSRRNDYPPLEGLHITMRLPDFMVPTVSQILAEIANTCIAVETSLDFDDWCRDRMRLPSDSEAYDFYRLDREMSHKVKQWLPLGHYEILLWQPLILEDSTPCSLSYSSSEPSTSAPGAPAAPTGEADVDRLV